MQSTVILHLCKQGLNILLVLLLHALLSFGLLCALALIPQNCTLICTAKPGYKIIKVAWTYYSGMHTKNL